MPPPEGQLPILDMPRGEPHQPRDWGEGVAHPRAQVHAGAVGAPVPVRVQRGADYLTKKKG